MFGYPKVNVRKGNYKVKHPNYKVSRGYRSYRGNPRVGAAVNFFRFKYKLSMNAIAGILGVSTRKVHRKNCFSRLVGGIAFDGARRRFRHEVKIVNSKGKVIGLNRLVLRSALYLIGELLSPYEITEDEPP